MILDGLLRRFRRTPPAAPSTAPAPRAGAERRRPDRPAPDTLGTGALRPLVAADGSLAGFEFDAGAQAGARLRRDGDADLARSHARNVLGAMRLCIGQGRVALARLPPAWLMRCEGEGLFVPGMHLVLDADDPGDDPQALAALISRLRAAGVRLGWGPLRTDTFRPLPGRPDFVPLPAPVTPGVEAWRAAIAAGARLWPGVPQVLLDLPDVDLMEATLVAPVVLAACALGAPKAPARVQALPPQAPRLLRLLHRLVRDDDHALVVADIKADAALAVRLLHHLNTAGASPGRPLESIDDAVRVLGRQALYRWVAQMLVRLAPPRPAAEALQAFALARARLLEALATAAGEPEPGSLYLLGLSAALPQLLGCSLDDALAGLPLPEAATQALREHRGPWRPYLALAEALEAGDMTAAAERAAPFGGIEAVMPHATRAWLAR